jgi:hypothetical protein
MCLHVCACVRVCVRACTHTHTHTHISLRFVSPLQDARLHTHTHTHTHLLALCFSFARRPSNVHWDMRSMTPPTRLQTDSRTFVAMFLQYERPRGFQKTPSEAPPRYAFETKEMRVAWQEGRELRTRGMSLHLPLCLARVLGRACAHVRQTGNRLTGCHQ